MREAGKGRGGFIQDQGYSAVVGQSNHALGAGRGCHQTDNCASSYGVEVWEGRDMGQAGRVCVKAMGRELMECGGDESRAEDGVYRYPHG